MKGNFLVVLVLLLDVLVVVAVERRSSKSEVETDGEEDVDFGLVLERNGPEVKGAAEGLSVVVVSIGGLRRTPAAGDEIGWDIAKSEELGAEEVGDQIGDGGMLCDRTAEPNAGGTRN